MRRTALLAALLLLPCSLPAFIVTHADSITSGSICDGYPGDWVRDDLCRIGTGLTNDGVPPNADHGEWVALLDFEPLIPPDFWFPSYVTNITIELQAHSSMIRDAAGTPSAPVTGAWGFYLLYRECLPGSVPWWDVGEPNWNFFVAGSNWQVAGCRGTNDRSQTPFLTVYFTNWPCNWFLASQRHSMVANAAEFNRWADNRDLASGIVVAPITNETDHYFASQTEAGSLRLICEYADFPPDPWGPTQVAVSNTSTEANVVVRWLSGNLVMHSAGDCTIHVWASTNRYTGTTDLWNGLANDCSGIIPTAVSSVGVRQEATLNDSFFTARGSDVLEILVNVIAFEGEMYEDFMPASAAAIWVVPNAADTQRPGDIALLSVTNGAGDSWFIFRFDQPSESCPSAYLDHVRTQIRYTPAGPIASEADWEQATNCGWIEWSREGEGTQLWYMNPYFELGTVYYFAARSTDQYGTNSLAITPSTPSFITASTGTGDPLPPTVTPLNHVNGGTIAAGSPLTYRVSDAGSPIDIATLTNAINIDAGGYTYYASDAVEVSYTGSGNTYDVTFTPSTPFVGGQVVVYRVSVWDTSPNPAPNRTSATFSVSVTGGCPTPPEIAVISPQPGEREVSGTAPIVFVVSDPCWWVDWDSLVLTVEGTEYEPATSPELTLSSSL